MTITAINSTASQVTAKAAPKVEVIEWKCGWSNSTATGYVIPGKSITIESKSAREEVTGYAKEMIAKAVEIYGSLNRTNSLYWPCQEAQVTNHSLAEKQSREELVEELKMTWLTLADWCDEQGHDNLAHNIRDRIAAQGGVEANHQAMVWNSRNELKQDVVQEFTKHYEVGNKAEYGSYNLVYFGEITKITAKSVFIRPYPTDIKQKRFTFEQFIARNWDDDEPKLKRNREWTD